MEEIKWIENVKAGVHKAPAGVDVRVSLHKKNKTQSTAITFYNNTDKKISHSGYMVVGVSTNRIYFKEEYLKKGYKISAVGKAGTTKITIKAKLVDFVGLYILEYDSTQELWFISSGNKIVEE